LNKSNNKIPVGVSSGEIVTIFKHYLRTSFKFTVNKKFTTVMTEMKNIMVKTEAIF